MTWVALIFRSESGFKAMYKNPLFAGPLPPVNPVALATAGSDLIISTKRAAAVVMADVGRDTIVGAGAVVTRPLPDRVIAAGVPARVVREVRAEDERWTVGAAAHYSLLSAWYRENLREVE